MCLDLIKNWKEETKKLRNSKEKIIGYKLINADNKSFFFPYPWTPGLNISNRKSTDLTDNELSTSKIDTGFHFFLEKPEICNSSYDFQCKECSQDLPHYTRNKHYKCRLKKPLNKVVQFEIDPEDLVAVGTWNLSVSFVATKATLVNGD